MVVIETVVVTGSDVLVMVLMTVMSVKCSWCHESNGGGDGNDNSDSDDRSEDNGTFSSYFNSNSSPQPQLPR